MNSILLGGKSFLKDLPNQVLKISVAALTPEPEPTSKPEFVSSFSKEERTIKTFD